MENLSSYSLPLLEKRISQGVRLVGVPSSGEGRSKERSFAMRRNNSAEVDLGKLFSGTSRRRPKIVVVSKGVTFTPEEYAAKNGNGQAQPELGHADSGEDVAVAFMERLTNRAPKRRKRKSPVANA